MKSENNSTKHKNTSTCKLLLLTAFCICLLSQFTAAKIINVKDDIGVFDNGVTYNASVINDYLDMYAVDGDTLLFPYTGTEYKISGTILINKRLNILGEKSPTITRYSQVAQKNYDVPLPLFKITCSQVTVKKMQLKGTGATRENYNIDVSGIYALGTSGSYLTDIDVETCIIYNWRGFGIRFRYVSNFNILTNIVKDITYAGIMAESCSYGLIKSNTVQNIRCLSSNDNGYGIAVTTKNAGEPRSSYVTVDDNTIKNVDYWEGLDTHAGYYIVFKNNTVKKCKRGIMVGQHSSGISPQHCDVISNTFTWEEHPEEEPTLPAAFSGINFTGSSTQKATGTVKSNTIIGYSHSTNPNEGAIRIHSTLKLKVTYNTIKVSSPSGICIYYNNQDFTIAYNSFEGTHGGGGITKASIRNRSSGNSGNICYNTFTKDVQQGVTSFRDDYGTTDINLYGNIY
jgi:parallel beta-helix repeat protein